MPKTKTRNVVPGDRFGRWTVMSEAPKRKNMRHFNCRCECGKEGQPNIYALVNGKSTSCGCFWKERIIALRTTHGQSGSPEYSVWGAMHDRCSLQSSKSYPDYGGRGIMVCDRWDKFENFLEDMGKRPGKGYSIERRDVNSGYSSENCYWATALVQARNKTNTMKITYEGVTRTLAEWAQMLEIDPTTMRYRYHQGMPPWLILHPIKGFRQALARHKKGVVPV